MKAAAAFAIINFVWQGAAIGVVAWLGFVTSRSPRVRYVIGIAALALMVAAPIVTGVTNYRQAAVPDSPKIEVSAERSGGEALRRGTQSFGESGTADQSGWNLSPLENPRLTSAVLTLWLVGVAILSLRLAFGWLGARRLTQRVTAAGADLQAVADRLIAVLRIRASVSIVESAFVKVPAVIGAFNPVVLLPAAAMSGLSMEQVEALVAHELAHVRRHDYLVNLLQSAVETLLFYHPAVWLVSRRVRQERELCCDDLALAVCGDRVAYASALADLESLRAVPSPALAANGGSLLARIRRILGHDEVSALSGRSRSMAGLAILAAIILLAGTQAARARGIPTVEDLAKSIAPGEMQEFPATGIARPIPADPPVTLAQGVQGGNIVGVQAGVTVGVPGGVPGGVSGGAGGGVQGGVTEGVVGGVKEVTTRVILAGDELGVAVRSPISQPEFSAHTFQVSADGAIVLPHLDRPLKVSGLAIAEAAEQIRRALIEARQYQNPIVDVFVVKPVVEPALEVAPEPKQSSGPSIAAGQIIRLEVSVGQVRQPDFNKDYTVQNDGTIYVPYVGAVKVGGLTAAVAQDAIASALIAKGTLPGARVLVSIEGRSSVSSVFVSGEVRLPGAVQWREGLTVEQAVSAVGLTPFADTARLHLQTMDSNAASPLKMTDVVPAGSVIVVPRLPNLNVTVQGAVRSPGTMALRADRNTISDAISQAGGFQPGAGARVFLHRSGSPDRTFSKDALIQGKVADNRVQDGDTIVVEVAPHIYVTGYVKSSSSEFNWEPGMTLGKALALAGGVSADGAANRIQVSRKDKTGKFAVIKLDKDTNATLLEPNDVVRVPKKRM